MPTPANISHINTPGSAAVFPDPGFTSNRDLPCQLDLNQEGIVRHNASTVSEPESRAPLDCHGERCRIYRTKWREVAERTAASMCSAIHAGHHRSAACIKKPRERGVWVCVWLKPSNLKSGEQQIASLQAKRTTHSALSELGVCT